MNELTPQEKKSILSFIVRQYYKENGYDKIITIDYLASEATSEYFMKFLKDIYEEEQRYNVLQEYLISNNYYGDDEDYFGEDKIMFISDTSFTEPAIEEILTYKEFCEYLEIACGFYIGFNKEQKEEVTMLFNKIKKKFLHLQ